MHSPLLQVHYTVADFLCATLIPELGTDVSAGAAGNVQFILIAVAAVGAFPHQLAVIFYDLDFAVIAANLTIIALGIQFCIHDIFVNMLHYRNHSRNVVLHVGYFYIAQRITYQMH